MTLKVYKSRIFGSETDAKLAEDGFWKVVVSIYEKLSEDGISWKEEKITAMGMGLDFDEAHKTALRSVLQEMNERVYSRGFDSLIEAIESEKETGNGQREVPANLN